MDLSEIITHSTPADLVDEEDLRDDEVLLTSEVGFCVELQELVSGAGPASAGPASAGNYGFETAWLDAVKDVESGPETTGNSAKSSKLREKIQGCLLRLKELPPTLVGAHLSQLIGYQYPKNDGPQSKLPVLDLTQEVLKNPEKLVKQMLSHEATTTMMTQKGIDLLQKHISEIEIGVVIAYTVKLTCALYDVNLGEKARTGHLVVIAMALSNRVDALDEAVEDDGWKTHYMLSTWKEILVLITSLVRVEFVSIKDMQSKYTSLFDLVGDVFPHIPENGDKKIMWDLYNEKRRRLPCTEVMRHIYAEFRAKMTVLHGLASSPGGEQRPDREPTNEKLFDVLFKQLTCKNPHYDIPEVVFQYCGAHLNKARKMKEVTASIEQILPDVTSKKLFEFLSASANRMKDYDSPQFQHKDAKEWLDELFSLSLSCDYGKEVTYYWGCVLCAALKALMIGDAPSTLNLANCVTLNLANCVHILTAATKRFYLGCKTPFSVFMYRHLLPPPSLLSQSLASQCIEKLATAVERRLTVPAGKQVPGKLTNVIVNISGQKFIAMFYVKEIKDGPLVVADRFQLGAPRSAGTTVWYVARTTLNVPASFEVVVDNEPVPKTMTLEELYEIQEGALGFKLDEKTDLEIIMSPEEIESEIQTFLKKKLTEPQLEQLCTLLEVFEILNNSEAPSSCTEKTLRAVTAMLCDTVEAATCRYDLRRDVYGQRPNFVRWICQEIFRCNPTPQKAPAIRSRKKKRPVVGLPVATGSSLVFSSPTIDSPTTVKLTFTPENTILPDDTITVVAPYLQRVPGAPDDLGTDIGGTGTFTASFMNSGKASATIVVKVITANLPAGTAFTISFGEACELMTPKRAQTANLATRTMALKDTAHKSIAESSRVENHPIGTYYAYYVERYGSRGVSNDALANKHMFCGVPFKDEKKKRSSTGPNPKRRKLASKKSSASSDEDPDRTPESSDKDD